MYRRILASALLLFLGITTSQSATATEAVETSEDTLGIEFWIARYVGGTTEPQRVSSKYRFCNGDRIALQLRATRDVHVAALVRTIDGDPEALAKYRDGGISALRDEVGRYRAAESGGWRMLFASKQRGRQLRADQVLTLPVADPVTLDNTPELQKVALVVSDREIDLAPYLAKTSGSELQTKLASWEDNTAASYASGGEIESYALAVDPSRPYVVDVTVSHYPCSRRMSLSRLDQQPAGGR